jgi:hypothetical protein
MPALANVALTNTFFEQMTRINQLVVKTNDMEYVSTNAFSTANMSSTNAAAAFLNSNNAFNKANAANSLAYNTGIGTNTFLLATIAGANTAVGTGANSYAATVGTSANTFLLATIAGANNISIAAFGRANAISIVANTSYDKANAANSLAYNTGIGANSFLLATITGANTAVGTAANNFASATIAGANNIAIAAFDKANTALANNTGTLAGSLTVTTSLGIGTSASGTTGEIRATNNITAYYSDLRLKTILGKILNPIEKLKSINGVEYTNNVIAEKYGYTNKEVQVGVIAQEIQKVLPQIVKAAPFDTEYDEDGNQYSKSGENFLTVQYEKIIPLLIEAIKEQQVQIEKLRAKIEE